MQAILYPRYGAPDILQLKDWALTRIECQQCCPLRETAEAFRYFERAPAHGKLNITMGQDSAAAERRERKASHASSRL